ncbi:MAG: hypothetical protein HKN94_11930 [Acidimicrobiales bacterium]|nr:hypothetical protein [Acidimicrobiales bacterium]RZV47129.1 MAG: hypothetical protein EX269_05490 [Acidimicrobiales bacterium]
MTEAATPEAGVLLRLQWRVTLVFVLATILNVATDGSIDLLYAIVCTVAFVFGFIGFSVGFWNGLQRSREETVTLWGLVAASSTHVPASARNTHWASIIIQLVTAVVAASLRPFTQQAFGLLVPMLGLGLAALWGSRYASFHPSDRR